MSKAEDLQLELATQINLNDKAGARSDLEQFVRQQTVSAYNAAQRFAEQSVAKSEVRYPSNSLGRQLKFISAMLRSQNPARIYYTIQDGYDTHASQEFTHTSLLRNFSRSIKAFLDDLKASGLEDRVVLLAFSEFGRRVAENESKGTDHGTAGPVFLAGSPVKGGLIGTTPDMTDLVDGDLKSSLDFRRIYATLLQDWLEVPSGKVLKSEYETMDLIV